MTSNDLLSRLFTSTSTFLYRNKVGSNRSSFVTYQIEGPKVPVECVRSHAAVPLFNNNKNKRVTSHQRVSFDRLVVVDVL